MHCVSECVSELSQSVIECVRYTKCMSGFSLVGLAQVCVWTVLKKYKT